MRASVHRYTMRDPGDVSQLATAIDAGEVNPAHIVAFIGKTEGNGLVNDYTRGYLVLSLKLLLAERLGKTPDAITKQPPVRAGRVAGMVAACDCRLTSAEISPRPAGARRS